MESTNESNLFELQVDHNGSAFLKEAAKWAKFLGILGFIFCAFFVLIGLFAGTMMSAAFGRLGGGVGGAGMMGGAFISVFYVVCAVLCFFPYLYLYNFGAKMQMALRANDQDQLNLGLKNLKSYLKFIGILAIIGLAFMLLAFIIGIAAAGSAMR
jgi:hypothetical protein